MWLLYATGAALCFGMRGVLYQRTSKLPAERSELLLGVYLCGIVVALAANAIVGQPWTRGALAGVLMGVFSYISNSSMYKGFAVGKTSLVAILTGLPPVVVIGIAYLLWGETLTWQQLAAFAIILCGIVLIRYSNDLTLTNLQGAQWGLLAMVTFALTDLSGKQATLWAGETLPTLVLMYVTGSLLFGISALRNRIRLSRTRMESSDSEAAKWPFRKTLAVGMAVGLTNISGMILILPAFRLGVTGLVSAIVALNVLMILFYARIFLKETFSRMEIIGISLAFCGVIVLRLFG